ncbi:MAG: bifunctional metallophosphatase/5'-nucleotidase [Erysipelotrichia bacterium]|nr:bifunctional metallophosphatase/5'-nucleotidase [Erysipelotrichia bacterium]
MTKLTIKSLLFLVLFPVSLFALSPEPFDVTEFTILHTSDIHAHLMAFDGPSGNAVGGYARIKQYKESLEKKGREVLMLSSGDIFQGTFFYRFFQGIPDIEFMNQTGYAAMTLGNHEFDNGQERLAEALSHARFPILAANIRFKKIPQLQARITPYTFVKVGKTSKTGRTAKIAIIGLCPEELKTIVQPVFVNDFDVVDAAETLRHYLPEIKKARPDMIILLSHLGWERELQLFEEFPELDAVLGGHTHLLTDPPAVVMGKRGHRFMSQSGEWGQHVTRYDISFYRNSSRKIEVNAAGQVAMSDKLEQDAVMADRIQKLWEQIQEKVIAPVAKAAVWLNGERTHVRNVETNLGNLMADCFAAMVPSDIALINGGGIRSSIATGTITIGDCLNVLPFDNYLVRLTMTGETLKKVFEQVAAQIDTAGGFGGFLQVSEGVKVNYNNPQPLRSFKGAPIDDNQLYTVTTIDFLAAGGNGLTAFTEALKAESTGLMTADMFMKYLSRHHTVAPSVEGRIKGKDVPLKVKMPKGMVKGVPRPRW